MEPDLGLEVEVDGRGGVEDGGPGVRGFDGGFWRGGTGERGVDGADGTGSDSADDGGDGKASRGRFGAGDRFDAGEADHGWEGGGDSAALVGAHSGTSPAASATGTAVRTPARSTPRDLADIARRPREASSADTDRAPARPAASAACREGSDVGRGLDERADGTDDRVDESGDAHGRGGEGVGATACCGGMGAGMGGAVGSDAEDRERWCGDVGAGMVRSLPRCAGSR